MIGKLEKGGVIRKLSNAGNSHRRIASWVPFFGKWRELPPKRAEVHNPEPVIKDISSCETTVWFKPSAAYPFLPGPNIDYDVLFTLKILNQKEISVDIKGSHNQFPFYEAQVNGDQSFYKYEPQCLLCGGPGVWDLNTTAPQIKVSPYILRER